MIFDESQPSSPTSPCRYVTAPTTPIANLRGRSKSFEYYYDRAPPQRQRTDNFSPTLGPKNEDFPSSYFNEFELVTSMKFSDQMGSETSTRFDHTLEEERRDTLNPANALAGDHEGYVDGLVIPLKLPPRLHHQLDSPHDLPMSSSPPTVCINFPFARLCSRRNDENDDFDPFMVALEKVREEKKRVEYKRSKSCSALRAISKCYSKKNEYWCCNEDKNNCEGSGSTPSSRARSSTKRSLGSFFRNRVRPDKTEESTNEESGKVHKLKSVVLRWSLYGREYFQQKPGYISRLMSFRLKRNQ